jgi:hypothetical protein
MYLGERRIFFQLIGLYSVSSGTVLFFWPRIASISMSVSRFLNNPMAPFVCVERMSFIASRLLSLFPGARSQMV